MVTLEITTQILSHGPVLSLHESDQLLHLHLEQLLAITGKLGVQAVTLFPKYIR